MNKVFEFNPQKHVFWYTYGVLDAKITVQDELSKFFIVFWKIRHSNMPKKYRLFFFFFAIFVPDSAV